MPSASSATEPSVNAKRKGPSHRAVLKFRGMRARHVTVGLFLLSVLALFAAIEGTTSTALFLKRFLTNPVTPNPQAVAPTSAYLQADPLLGWVNRPNVALENASGAGRWLHHNAQGYRDTQDTPPDLQPGEVRVVCSGDSFTFGFGVSDDETWCHQLEKLGHWNTVNMGLNGYGLDQIFLRYRRDSPKIAHQIHILGFIYDDIDRMRSQISFFKASKPVLESTPQGLRVVNDPVRDDWKMAPWIFSRQTEIQQLKTVELMQKLLPQPAGPHVLTDAQIRQNTLAIFDELAALSKNSNHSLLVVQIPTLRDFADADRNAREKELGADLDRRGIARLDLIDKMKEIPLRDLTQYFIPGDYHYTAAGNRLLAHYIYPAAAAQLKRNHGLQ